MLWKSYCTAITRFCMTWKTHKCKSWLHQNSSMFSRNWSSLGKLCHYVSISIATTHSPQDISPILFQSGVFFIKIRSICTILDSNRLVTLSKSILQVTMQQLSYMSEKIEFLGRSKNHPHRVYAPRLKMQIYSVQISI